MKKILIILCLFCLQLNAAGQETIDGIINNQSTGVNSSAAELLETEDATEVTDVNSIIAQLGFNISREKYDNPLVQIQTTMGDIILELFPGEAPLTVKNFLDLVNGEMGISNADTTLLATEPFYDGQIFHRVIDNFMIQGGSPTGSGDGGPGYSFRDEINAGSLGLDDALVIQPDGTPHPLLGIQSQADFQREILAPLYQKMGINNQAELEANIDLVDTALRTMTVQKSYENLGYQYTDTVISRTPERGVIAMANSGPNTNGSQFFINLVDTEWLTGKHTVFGIVRVGMNVIDAIAKVPVNAEARPLQDVVITSIRQLQD